MKKLAVFDLDFTLLCGDSDSAFIELLIEEGLVDENTHKEQKDVFYQQYLDCNLDINEFLKFSMSFLVGKKQGEMDYLYKKFMDKYILPIVSKKSQDMLEKHRKDGDKILILTTTNQFVTKPCAEYFDVDLLATKPEIKYGIYTGKPSGFIIEGKTKYNAVKIWLMKHNLVFGDKLSLDKAYFYTDSYNDVELMHHVKHPIAINPDKKLEATAKENNWKIIFTCDKEALTY
jgi:HAD superfamily hydrolase (TIGR01490 family)